MNTIKMPDDGGTNNFAVKARWMVCSSGTWVENRVIQSDSPACPTLAENAKNYWISCSTHSDVEPVIKCECVSVLPANKAPVRVSDTNKYDRVWFYKTGPITIDTAADNFAKVRDVQIGGEPVDADNSPDDDFDLLKYYDGTWRPQTHHKEPVAGAGLKIVQRSGGTDSAAVGDKPSC